jgi:hypothetical protein
MGFRMESSAFGKFGEKLGLAEGAGTVVAGLLELF